MAVDKALKPEKMVLEHKLLIAVMKFSEPGLITPANTAFCTYLSLSYKAEPYKEAIKSSISL